MGLLSIPNAARGLVGQLWPCTDLGRIHTHTHLSEYGQFCEGMVGRGSRHPLRILRINTGITVEESKHIVELPVPRKVQIATFLDRLFPRLKEVSGSARDVWDEIAAWVKSYQEQREHFVQMVEVMISDSRRRQRRVTTVTSIRRLIADTWEPNRRTPSHAETAAGHASGGSMDRGRGHRSRLGFRRGIILSRNLVSAGSMRDDRRVAGPQDEDEGGGEQGDKDD
ncbi:hypothetical protein FA13DRAFT_1780289 [Coprinellus micaceus]|uniref:Uncharacterized protein n=1 Tax=Coprinellus micaceus TaxID=71717 RepID=A0A4Y7SEK9_COPMI|nr:hypothetical protein FA13DRAFT_1780289 [Coprinellus micaceus]